MSVVSDRLFLKVPVSLVVVLFFSLVSNSFAHRSQDEQRDPCRIQVGYEPMHFTAYTPTFSKSKQYCQEIPHLGLTNLVFEPEGTRVFYQQPEKYLSGTFAKNVDLTTFGVGAYMAHITIFHKEKKLDTHLPFNVKPKSGFGLRFLMLIVLMIALGYGYKIYRARLLN